MATVLLQLSNQPHTPFCCMAAAACKAKPFLSTSEIKPCAVYCLATITLLQPLKLRSQVKEPTGANGLLHTRNTDADPSTLDDDSIADRSFEVKQCCLSR